MVRGTLVTGMRWRRVVESRLPRPPSLVEEEGEGDGSAEGFWLRESEGQRWMWMPRRRLRPEAQASVAHGVDAVVDAVEVAAAYAS